MYNDKHDTNTKNTRQSRHENCQLLRIAKRCWDSQKNELKKTQHPHDITFTFDSATALAPRALYTLHVEVLKEGRVDHSSDTGLGARLVNSKFHTSSSSTSCTKMGLFFWTLTAKWTLGPSCKRSRKTHLYPFIHSELVSTCRSCKQLKIEST